MKQWWLIVALLLSVGINIGFLLGRSLPRVETDAPEVSRETPPPPSTPGRSPRFIGRMADELGLEGELRDRFVARQARFFEEMLTGRRDFAALQSELRQQLLADEPDRQAIDELLAEIAEGHVFLERVFVDNLLDTRELLDPEQERRYLRFLHRLRSARGEAQQRLRDRFGDRSGDPGERRQRLGRSRWGAGRGGPSGSQEPGESPGERPGEAPPG